jgi:hypothetical protein
MKDYFLLRLENGANVVLKTIGAKSRAAAIEFFNTYFYGTGAPKLDADGYAKRGEVSWCVAEGA